MLFKNTPYLLVVLPDASKIPSVKTQAEIYPQATTPRRHSRTSPTTRTPTSSLPRTPSWDGNLISQQWEHTIKPLLTCLAVSPDASNAFGEVTSVDLPSSNKPAAALRDIAGDEQRRQTETETWFLNKENIEGKYRRAVPRGPELRWNFIS